MDYFVIYQSLDVSGDVLGFKMQSGHIQLIACTVPQPVGGLTPFYGCDLLTTKDAPIVEARYSVPAPPASLDERVPLAHGVPAAPSRYRGTRRAACVEPKQRLGVRVLDNQRSSVGAHCGLVEQRPVVKHVDGAVVTFHPPNPQIGR